MLNVEYRTSNQLLIALIRTCAQHNVLVSFHLFVFLLFFQADRVEEQFTFQYGPCKGDPGFREQLASFLSQEYGDVVDRLVCLQMGLGAKKNLPSGFANNKGTDQPAHPRSLISTFVFRFLESIISKLATSEFSTF